MIKVSYIGSNSIIKVLIEDKAIAYKKINHIEVKQSLNKNIIFVTKRSRSISIRFLRTILVVKIGSKNIVQTLLE